MRCGLGVAYFQAVSILVKTYYAGNSLVHRCNVKVKLALFAAYATMLFFVQDWVGIFAATALLLCVTAASRIPFRRMGLMLVPVLALATVTIVANSFALNVDAASTQTVGLGNVSAGVLASLEPVRIAGQFGWHPAGFAQGCFYALRIVLLMVASFLLCFTTTSLVLTSALSDFLRPLRFLKIPVDDVATIFALALRFIPVTAEEMERVRSAQLSRGATIDAGTLSERLHAWRAVFVPVFVGMLRRSDTLACAMTARCYGVPDVRRTSLNADAMTAESLGVLVAGLLLIVVLAVAF